MPNGGIEVVEARVRRDNRADLDQRIRALVPVGGQGADRVVQLGAGQGAGVSQTRTQSTYMCWGSFLSGISSAS